MKTEKAITLLKSLPKEDYKPLVEARKHRIRVRLNNATELGFRKLNKLIKRHEIPTTSDYKGYHHSVQGVCVICRNITHSCTCKVEVYDQNNNLVRVIV